jgi:hypothetical protein
MSVILPVSEQLQPSRTQRRERERKEGAVMSVVERNPITARRKRSAYFMGWRMTRNGTAHANI